MFPNCMYADQKPHCGFRPAFFIAYNAIKIEIQAK